MTSLTSKNINKLSQRRKLRKEKRKAETYLIYYKNKELIMELIEEVFDSIGEFTKDMKNMMLASCSRITTSFVKKYKVRKHIIKVIIISVIWLVIKAYAVDEEEEEWIDLSFMNEFLDESAPNLILKYERLIFKHLKYDVCGIEKRSPKNPCNFITN